LSQDNQPMPPDAAEGNTDGGFSAHPGKKYALQ
jgi:hypothetical protein